MALINTGTELAVGLPELTDKLVKVTANDTTSDYLFNKIGSSDNSVVIAVLNPGGDETFDITVSSAGEANTGSNLGGGKQVFKQKTGVDFEFRTLTAGTNITLNQTATEIEIVATGGATTFLALTDTPATYVGQALKVVRVNAGETALEFATLTDTNFANTDLTFTANRTHTLAGFTVEYSGGLSKFIGAGNTSGSYVIQAHNSSGTNNSWLVRNDGASSINRTPTGGVALNIQVQSGGTDVLQLFNSSGTAFGLWSNSGSLAYDVTGAVNMLILNQISAHDTSLLIRRSSVSQIALRQTSTGGEININDNAASDKVYFSGSANVDHYIRNGGGLVIGTSATTTTNNSVGIELNSVVQAILLSRMTTAERDALNATNGMLVYNTTTNAFNFYENGAWVSGSALA